ncbi:MAG: L,D-transpeptidase [Thermoleophilaceae bacterium]
MGAGVLVALVAAVPATASGTSESEILDALEVRGEPGATIGPVRPRQAAGGYVAKVLYRVQARRSPGRGRVVSRVSTESLYSRNATRLMVLGARRDARGRPWLEVQLPVRPNGTTGWIPADAALVRRSGWFVRVRLRPRTVSVFRAGRLVRGTRAVVGTSRTPTPQGLFAIYEKARRSDPEDFLGPWALHLTAFSEVLYNFGGGTGRVAIHGRGPESRAQAGLGTAASHGCIRVDNGPIRRMAGRLPPGTPVRITGR